MKIGLQIIRFIFSLENVYEIKFLEKISREVLPAVVEF